MRILIIRKLWKAKTNNNTSAAPQASHNNDNSGFGALGGLMTGGVAGAALGALVSSKNETPSTSFGKGALSGMAF
jgi:hypothetical protein